MATMWYYASKNQQKGPVTWDELRGLAEAGQLRSADMVWEEGTPDWVRAGQVRGLVNGAADIRADEPAPRRRRERDFDEPDIRRRPRRARQSSKGLIIGLIVGGAVLVVAAVVVIIIIVADRGGGNAVPGPPPGKVVDGGLPAPTNIAAAPGLGTRINGVLNNLDARDPGRPGCHCKVYQAQMTAGKTYIIEMKSGPLDSYLRLVDSKAIELTRDDDGGAGLDSMIVFRPERTDHYRIVCTTCGPGETGPFTLIVREER